MTGIVLMALFNSAPRYSDPVWARHVRDMDSARFSEAHEANVTVGSKLWHCGAGLATLGAVLGIGGVALRVRQFDDLHALTTPHKVWPLFLMTTVTVYAVVPASSAWLNYTFQRGDYPWWSDSIAIPKFWSVLTVVVLLPLLNGLLTVCVWRSSLPASLWLRPRSVKGWLATTLAVPVVALILFLLIGAVKDGAFFIPLLVCLSYVVACGRAAAASGLASV